MAQHRKTILNQVESILDDEPVLEAPKPIPIVIENDAIETKPRSQSSDLKMLLWLSGYTVSDDKISYHKDFAHKKYSTTVVFQENNKVKIDCTMNGSKVYNVADAFNWIS